MITLYVRTGCPFSAKAIAALDAYNVPFTEKNIADPGVLEELMELGGKKQVPFLDDDNMTPIFHDDDILVYESDKIIAHIEEKYGKDTAGEHKVTIYLSENTTECPRD